MYYSVLGTIITVLIGTLVSWILATKEDVCDVRLLNPYYVKFTKWLVICTKTKRPIELTN